MDRRGDIGEKEGKRQHLASDRMGGPTPGLRVCVISFPALRFTTALFGRSLRRARAAALTRPRLLSSQLLARCLGNRRRLVRTAETAAGLRPLRVQDTRGAWGRERVGGNEEASAAQVLS